MSNNNNKSILHRILFFGFFIFLFVGYKFIIYFTPGEQLTEVFKIQNVFERLKVSKQIDNQKDIDYTLVNSIFPSKGYFVSIKPDSIAKPQPNGYSNFYYVDNTKTKTLYIHSNGYNKDLCNDLIDWANMSDLRKSSFGKALRSHMDNYFNTYNDMVENNLTMNGKSLKDSSLECQDKNDLVYTGTY